ncbi:winged helix DNA-binding protein [Sphingomonas sp. RS6]
MQAAESSSTQFEGYSIDREEALIVADSAAAGEAGMLAARGAGYVVDAPIGLAEAIGDYGRLDRARLIAVETADADPALVETVLTRVDALAHARGIGVVVTMPLDRIDQLIGLLDPGVQLLCDPSPAERLAAMAGARWRWRGRLNDSNGDEIALRMRRFQEEVARIADTLARLTRSAEAVDEGAASLRNETLRFRAEPAEPVDITAAEIRRVIRARRMRADYFAGDLFADPAWDMLLDLFASDLERRPVSVSSLCIAAAVPPTTALRWIGTLNEAGLFERRADPNDRRRAYIALSERARDAMVRLVGGLKRAGLGLV